MQAAYFDHLVFRVDLDLNCIKGGGACHLREKVLAEAAETCVALSLKNVFLLMFSVQVDRRRGLSQKL